MLQFALNLLFATALALPQGLGLQQRDAGSPLFCARVSSRVAKEARHNEATAFCSSYLGVPQSTRSNIITATKSTINSVSLVTVDGPDVETSTSTTPTRTHTSHTTVTQTNTVSTKTITKMSTLTTCGLPRSTSTTTSTSALHERSAAQKTIAKPNGLAHYQNDQQVSAACGCFSIPTATTDVTLTSIVLAAELNTNKILSTVTGRARRTETARVAADTTLLKKETVTKPTIVTTTTTIYALKAAPTEFQVHAHGGGGANGKLGRMAASLDNLFPFEFIAFSEPGRHAIFSLDDSQLKVVKDHYRDNKGWTANVFSSGGFLFFNSPGFIANHRHREDVACEINPQNSGTCALDCSIGDVKNNLLCFYSGYSREWDDAWFLSGPTSCSGSSCCTPFQPIVVGSSATT